MIYHEEPWSRLEFIGIVLFDNVIANSCHCLDISNLQNHSQT